MQHRTLAEQVLFNHDLFPLIVKHLPTAADVGRLKAVSTVTMRLGIKCENQLMNNPVDMLRFMMTMDKIQLSLFLRYLRRYAFYDCDRAFYHQALKNKADHLAVVFAALMMPRNHVVELLPHIQSAHDYLITQGFNPAITLMQSLQFIISYAEMGNEAFKRFAEAYFNLRGLSVHNLNLKGASLAGACFEGAYLTNATFDFANLNHANFYLATLEGVWMMGARLKGADLSYANMHGATICGTKLHNANLCGTHLARARLTIHPDTVDVYDDDACKAPEMQGARFNKQTTFPTFFTKTGKNLINVSKPTSSPGCTIC